MLERRNYTAIQYTENDSCGKKPRFIASKEDDRVVVFFIEHNKVTIQVIKSILATATDITHIIIVYAFSLTPDAKQSVNTNSPYQFEIFSFDEMSYDPIEIVPPHRKIVNRPPEWNKLPIILTNDMIARYYWFKQGDVIAIDENGYTSYRKCVSIK